MITAYQYVYSMCLFLKVWLSCNFHTRGNRVYYSPGIFPHASNRHRALDVCAKSHKIEQKSQGDFYV